MSKRRYAAQTKVPVIRSRAEIERTLTNYGATSFVFGWEEERHMVMFRLHERTIRFVLEDPDEKPSRIEQARRQRWRALVLLIKAKLESVHSGITVFDQEFLAHIVMNDGKTVGQVVIPKLDAGPGVRLLGP